MSYTVRKAEKKDLDSIKDDFYDFQNLYNSKFSLIPSDSYLEEIFAVYIKDHVGYVCEKDGDVVGFIFGAYSPHIYNPQVMTLVQSLWWVKKEHRNTRAAYLLLDKFIEDGKRHADWVICNTIEEADSIKEDIFLKRNFKLKEKSFLLEV